MKNNLQWSTQKHMFRRYASANFIFILVGLSIVSHDAFAQDSMRIPPKRAHHALVYDELNRSVLMTFGSTPLNGGQSFAFYNDIWSFDGKRWTLKGRSGNERSGAGLAYDSKRNKIYSFGGYNGDSSLSDLRVLENGAWKAVTYLPQMTAAEPGFVYDVERDRLVLFGGSAGRGKANSETWEWDGNAWTKFNGTGPGARQAFSMVYDTKRKKTVLYGGMGTAPDQLFHDTWEFDGLVWVKVSEEGPGARSSAGFAYDAANDIMIIFGGMGKEGFTNDTWGWNGKTWKQLAASGPSARVMGYMAFDKNRNRIVLFGGRPGWPNDVNDTWEWNGKEWINIK
jgi:N-acetylneuraminic acid mutarotase